MFMTKDDCYVILLITNSKDEVIGYCHGLTENSPAAYGRSVYRPLECNIKYGESAISTLYYTKDEFNKFIAMCDTLYTSKAKYLDSLEVCVNK